MSNLNRQIEICAAVKRLQPEAKQGGVNTLLDGISMYEMLDAQHAVITKKGKTFAPKTWQIAAAYVLLHAPDGADLVATDGRRGVALQRLKTPGSKGYEA